MAGAQKTGDEDVISDINIVPLVDVILVLLIVFMITMPTIVGVAQIKVDLPVTEAAAIAAEALPLHFALRREASGEVQLYMEERPTDIEGLREVVKNIVVESTEVSLAADRGIAYGEVIRVMDMLGSLGLHKIALDTKHSR
jgi:biopolymer transport protein ExbD